MIADTESSAPTTLMDTATVTADMTAISMDSVLTGSPDALAKSSSLVTEEKWRSPVPKLRISPGPCRQ